MALNISISAVEVLSFNTLLISFTEPLSLDDINFSADNYVITGLPVKSVIAEPGTAVTELLLSTDVMDSNLTYTISAGTLVSASGNAFFDLPVEFGGKRTKLDKVLTSTPTLYDTNPESIVRQVLTAIHREDEKIGGTEGKV